MTAQGGEIHLVTDRVYLFFLSDGLWREKKRQWKHGGDSIGPVDLLVS